MIDLFKDLNLMNESVQEVANSHDDKDNLQDIKGIGQATARTLNQIGIHRFSDLASFTPDGLADALKAIGTGINISAQRIEREDWIGQAAALAKETKLSKLAASEAVPFNSLRKMRRADDWHELADFFVSFGYTITQSGVKLLQTQVHHSQNDESEKWDGIESKQLVDWMISHAHLPEDRDETNPSTNQESGNNSGSEEHLLTLSNLRVSELKNPTTISGEIFTNALRVEYIVELANSGIELTYKGISFIVELHLADLQTQQLKPAISHSVQLLPGLLKYDLAQEFAILTNGNFQLYIVARLLPPAEATTQITGPIIRVGG